MGRPTANIGGQRRKRSVRGRVSRGRFPRAEPHHGGLLSGYADGLAGTFNFTVQVTGGGTVTKAPRHDDRRRRRRPTNLLFSVRSATSLRAGKRDNVHGDRVPTTDAGTTLALVGLGAGAPAGATTHRSTGAFSWIRTSDARRRTSSDHGPGGHGTASLSDEVITVTVNAATAAGPMTVTPAGGLTSSGTAGGPFTPPSVTYTVTNTGASPMNWTATKVASWVTLSAAGGTLAAGANTTVTASINSGANSLAAGSYSDNITFTNTSNGTGNTTRPVSLTVNATAAPTISTVSLPAGAVNTAYSQTLAATGGTTPYSWSVSAGTLPAGLSLSAAGVLDGTPTAEGTSSFTVRVAGANSASSTKDFSVTINAAAPPPPITLSTDSGGGGCSVAVRTGSGGSAIDGTLILAGLGMTVWGIRIRRRRG